MKRIDEYERDKSCVVLFQTGAGYYLVHKEGGAMHAHSIPKRSDARTQFLVIKNRIERN